MATTKYRILMTFLIILVTLFSFCNARNILYSGGTKGILLKNEYIENGKYILRMQADCNLVLYDRSFPVEARRHTVWATGTTGGGTGTNCDCILGSDGNLKVYDEYGRTLWASSNTKRDAGHYVLVLQEDRDMVIYGSSVWSSNTKKVNARDGKGAVSVIDTRNTTST